MSREALAWLLAVLLLIVSGWWLSENTEWVEDRTPRGARGEALTNPVYAAEQLLRRLGMTVEHHESLDRLPPTGARLVLLSADWQLVPGRLESLQRWVEQGGHLVLPHGADDDDDDALDDWLPIADLPSGKPVPKEPPVLPGLAASAPTPETHTHTELVSTPPLWGSTARLVTCDNSQMARVLHLRPGHTASWTASRGQDVRAMRVAVGRGSVTRLSHLPSVFFNTPALRCDTPLLLAAAVQAEPGATAWVYLQEKREALLPWLWQQAWVGIVLALLALALSLWRAAVRFGPLRATPPRLRRSVAEQVTGLGAWLQRGGTEALLAAQQRALDETAARHLPRYRGQPVPERARLIAEATGLPALDLAAAMTARYSTRAELANRLQLLETARRRLS